MFHSQTLRQLLFVFVLSSTCALSTAASADEANWPQWQGPTRDNTSTETGLLKQWPEGGPKRVWMFEDCGAGFGGPAIVDGKIYVLSAKDSVDHLLCVDATTGKQLWATPLGPALKNDWSDGSRSTPTISAGHAFVLTGQGNVACVRLSDHAVVWQKTMQSMGGAIPRWGFAESPLVDGERVICTPGGAQGAIVALDRLSGDILWRMAERTDPAHYASVTPAVIRGQRQYVQLLFQALVGVEPETGKLLWQVDFRGQTAVIPTPIVFDNQVFATSGYGSGCMLASINEDGTATKVYDNQIVKNHHGGVIRLGDYLYGHSNDIGWQCVEISTGQRKWRERTALGKGSLAYADGLFYCLSESDGQADADVVLVEPSTEAWKEISRFKLSPQSEIRKQSGRIWTHLVIAGGRMYLRDQDKLYCYDVKAQ